MSSNEKSNNDNSRRDMIKKSLTLGGIATVAAVPAVDAIAQSCRNAATPAQVEGPYYPVRRPRDRNNDLSHVQGRRQRARGVPLILRGRVLTAGTCRPIPNAIVEIWQADANGKYDHPSDNSRHQLDPNFQYQGISRTDANGNYAFRTIVPGIYPGRTRHLHVKVHGRGFYEFTSQIYFASERARNARDGIYQRLGTAGQRMVTVNFRRSGNGVVGNFDISLRGVRGFDELLLEDEKNGNINQELILD